MRQIHIRYSDFLLPVAFFFTKLHALAATSPDPVAFKKLISLLLDNSIAATLN